jgi:hypothetical protein
VEPYYFSLLFPFADFNCDDITDVMRRDSDLLIIVSHAADVRDVIKLRIVCVNNSKVYS